MIAGIGIDIVESGRFQKWNDYSSEQLAKVFSETEIKEALNISPINRPLFFASRFAVKEAFYKAFCSALTQKNILHKLTFSDIRTLCEITKKNEVPFLKVDWKKIQTLLKKEIPSFNSHLSISHERTHALAFVVLEYL
jgi:holo-[acyl-carrier protein] synthase